jgi:hypothetical protein
LWHHYRKNPFYQQTFKSRKKLVDELSIEKKIEKNVFFKGNRFSSKLGGSKLHYDPKKGLSRMAEATIEGLAFPTGNFFPVYLVRKLWYRFT